MPWKVWGTGPNDSSPFNFIADAFFHPSENIAAWANRGGGKTLGASILAGLEHTFSDRLHSRLLAGKLDQADVLYSYLKEWLFLPILRHKLQDGKPGRKHTRIGGGTVEILPASDSSVRGPHIQRLYQDEIDSWPDVALIGASMGMVSTRHGIPGRRIVTSTWHHATGPMDELTTRHKEMGLRLHRWTIWESIQRCPVERHEQGAGCRTCKLAVPCLAKAREFQPGSRTGVAAKQPCGLIAIDDAINLLQGWSKAQWDAEYECKRPSVEGLVYPDFDADTHRARAVPKQLTIYRAIDWGRRTFVCLWLGYDKTNDTTYVLDTYRKQEGLIPQHSKYVTSHRYKQVADTYVDPSGRNVNDQTGRTNIQEFEAAGIPCTYTLSKRLIDVHNGVQWVTAAISPASGPPRLYYVDNENNRTFVRAMQTYHNKELRGIWLDEPQKPQDWDHIPDALRYYYANRQRSGGIGVVGVGAS